MPINPIYASYTIKCPAFIFVLHSGHLVPWALFVFVRGTSWQSSYGFTQAAIAQWLRQHLGRPVVPFYPFFGEGSLTKIDYRKKGTLILTSLLEDLDILWLAWRSASANLFRYVALSHHTWDV